MIVLVTTSTRANECAEAIGNRAHAEVRIAGSFADLADALQHGGVDAAVIDEAFQQNESRLEGLLFSHAANPIHVNLSLHAASRVASEVQAALGRRANERLIARSQAAEELRNELRGDVTAVLLTAGLALKEPLSAEESRLRWRTVQEAAERMRERLEESLPETKGLAVPLRSEGNGRPRQPRQ